MRDEKLIKLLERIRNHCVDTNMDLELLWPRLIMNNHLTQDEKDLIYSMHNITSAQKKLKMFDLLQSKDEKVFQTLHYLFKFFGWSEALDVLVTGLHGTPYSYLIEEHTVILKEDKSLKTSWDNLKVHYKERSELVESYWRQFGVKGILSMETFYNHNVVISNEKYKQIQEKIKSIDDMFSTDFKRIIVMAEAGYGKSTFVHEMARQWVKGDKDWTRKFEFLFLFRLTEVNEDKSKSLEKLLSLCFRSSDASKVYNWLQRDENMSKALFIFDGLDELRQNFCEEVNEVIFGTEVNLATVVITSRKCKKLEDIEKDMEPKLYIELKGYTNEGVVQQLEKFSIAVGGMKKDLKNHLKIPLFNTIYCITQPKSSLGCTNIFSSIRSFVNFAINRYRNSNQSFTGSCEEGLLLTLGQAAQNKFSFVMDAEIPYPNVSRDHLFWAVNSGLLHTSSLKDDLVFAHQTIAEYCAAYFWWKTSHLLIKKCNSYCMLNHVELTEPKNGKLPITEPFCQFLCLLCPDFKQDLWLKFRRYEYVPTFDEYENLPDKQYTGWHLHFSSHSVEDQVTIMNKLRFQENSELKLSNGQFEPEKLFKTIRNLKKLYLDCCTFNIGAEEFFIHFINVQSLTFDDCKFYDLKKVPNSEESNPSQLLCPTTLQLHLLRVVIIEVNYDSGIETFLSFIMKHFTLMKSFELHANVIPDCGLGWISELKNNKSLRDSIEECKLTVRHKLTKSQANALADLLEIGLCGLKNITLDIKMENQVDYEPILKNLSKLSALTSLNFRNEPFTTDTSIYLTSIFNKLKFKELHLLHCTFNIGAEDFFLHFTYVQSLTFEDCKFYDLKKEPDSDESNASHLPQLHLQKLYITDCSGIETFLSFIMKHFTLMKSFELEVNVIPDCGLGWISELKNNKGLRDSIENCKLIVQHKLTKLQASALADLLEIGLCGLKHIYLNIKMENQEDYEPILKNLCKLSALTSLHLRNEPFTTDTLNYTTVQKMCPKHFCNFCI